MVAKNTSETIRVLLLEDNPDHAMILFETTQSIQGISILQVDCLADAITTLASGHFDVVLSDLFLPDSEGEDTINSLKSRFPNIPVIVLSSIENTDLAERAIAVGADDYIVKSRLDKQTVQRALRYAVIRYKYSQLSAAARVKSNLATIIESTEDPIFHCDAGLNILSWNRGSRQLFGYSDAKALTMRLRDLFPTDEWTTRIHPMIEKVLDGQSPHPFNARFLDDKKNPTLVSVRLNPIQSDSQVEGISIICHDIRGLLAAEERFRVLVKESPTAMVVTDTEGRVTLINEEAEKLFGYSSENFKGRNFSELMPAMLQPQYFDLLRLAATHDKQDNFGPRKQLQATKSSGEVFPMEIRLNHILISNGEFMVASIVDLTEIKKSEEHLAKLNQELEKERQAALRASDYKTRFLASMSHEIRTPLNAILGMGELLTDAELSEEHARYLKIQTDAGNTLLNIINSVLDLSKIDAGALNLEKAPINLRSLVQEVVDMLTVTAQTRKLWLKCNIGKDLVENVYGDSVRLKQVIINLTNNALKFTHKGGVTIEVENKKQGDLHCEILFRITDTGIGIPANKIGSIFQDYVQVDDSNAQIWWHRLGLIHLPAPGTAHGQSNQCNQRRR